MAQEITLTNAQAGQRIDRVIQQFCPQASYSMIQKWIRTGQVRLDGKRAKASQPVSANQTLRLPPQAQEYSGSKVPPMPPALVAQIKEQLLYEDDDLVVINKSAGVPTQAGSKHNISIDRLLREAYPELLIKPVHRLDRDTSGCLVFAKTASAAKELSNAFKNQQIQKTYIALCHGSLQQAAGVLVDQLIKAGPEGQQKMKVVIDEGQRAETVYKTLARAGQSLLIEAKPKTGRMHQIRVQLAHAGAPLIGDARYDSTQKLNSADKKIQFLLHAQVIEFKHPISGEMVQVSASIPEHWQATLAALQLPTEVLISNPSQQDQ